MNLTFVLLFEGCFLNMKLDHFHPLWPVRKNTLYNCRSHQRSSTSRRFPNLQPQGAVVSPLRLGDLCFIRNVSKSIFQFYKRKDFCQMYVWLNAPPRFKSSAQPLYANAKLGRLLVFSLAPDRQTTSFLSPVCRQTFLSHLINWPRSDRSTVTVCSREFVLPRTIKRVLIQ